jgi:hypothetical protein
VSPELRALIEDHRARLRRLLHDHHDFFIDLSRGDPSLVEREAAATVLHSFYTGVETILRSIADGLDGGVAKTDTWHATLLEAMARPTPARPAALSASTADRLREFMVFRHRFRNMYGFELNWTLMQPLVAALQSTLQAFEDDLDKFMRASAQGS